MSIPPRNTPLAVAKVPVIQYSSGHTRGRKESNAPFMPFPGFHSEAGKDAAFDEACARAMLPRIEIRHGSGTVRTHWLFGERLGLYPVTTGPVATSVAGSLANGNARRTADAGIGMVWAQGEKSRAAVRGYLVPLVKASWVNPVQLAVSSRMTDALIAALVRHTEVCAIADNLVDRTAHPEPIGLYELLLPLELGAETTSGNGKDEVVLYPLASGHVEQIERGYIRSVWRPSSVVLAAERDWASVVSWAHDYAAGATGGSDE